MQVYGILSQIFLKTKVFGVKFQNQIYQRAYFFGDRMKTIKYNFLSESNPLCLYDSNNKSINWYVTNFALIYVKWQQDNKYSSNRAWENRRGAVVVTASGKSSRLLWKTIDAWLNVNELCIKTFYCSKNHFCKEEISREIQLEHQSLKIKLNTKRNFFLESNLQRSFISGP